MDVIRAISLEYLVILVVLVVMISFAREKKGQPRGTKEPRIERQRSEPRVTGPKPSVARAPFDAKTAKPTPSHPEIVGPAYIIDGDSIVISKTQIRLFGVDAPEMNHPFGQKAKWALVKLCKGQKIRAVVTEIDHFDRTVARCYLPDGRDLSAEMVKLGLAIDWPKYSGGIYRSLEVHNARKRMWLADARQKGRMHVWEQFDYDQMRKKKTV